MDFINLLTYSAFASENLYDQLSIEHGIHLRWSYHPRLPYPAGGFSVVKGQNPPQLLASLKAPVRPGDLVKRLSSHPQFAVLRLRFGLSAEEMFDLLAELLRPADPYARHQRILYRAGTKSNLRLKLQDSLLMACLDPYLARMAGLYFIDHDATPGREESYQVIGHWGTENWPLYLAEFQHLPPISYINKPARVEHLTLMPLNRMASLIDPGEIDIYDQKHLALSGTGTPAVRIQVDFPVERIGIKFYAASSPATSTWDIAVDGATVRVRGDRNGWEYSRAGRPFQTIDIISGPAETWRWMALIYQEKVGSIGDQGSEYSWSATTAPAYTRVSVPKITLLESKKSIPILDQDGYIKDRHSDVNIWATHNAPEDYPHLAARIYFSRLTGRIGDPNRGFFLNAGNSAIPVPSPVQHHPADPVLPELHSFLAFNNNLSDSKTIYSGSPVGRHRFVQDHPENSRKWVLKLDGQGCISLRNLPTLKCSGKSLSIHCWLRINRDNTQTHPTITGNNWTTAWWWGLRRIDENEYKLRFWLNHQTSGREQVFESMTNLPADTWILAGVCYDGEKVRFYLHSAQDSEHEADLGDIPWNGGEVVVGADSGSNARRINYPFKGSIADLAFWQRRINPEEGLALIEKHISFFNQQKDQAALIYHQDRMISFRTSEPPVRLPDKSFLQSLGNSFTIAVWVKPSKERENFPTLVGNNWQQSFWLGLRYQGTVFIPRFWLNKDPANFNNVFEATAGIPPNQWSHVVISYNGREIRFYINLSPRGVHRRELGLLRTNSQPITLGADATSTSTRKDYPLTGQLSGLQIWRQALTPGQIDRALSSLHCIDRFLVDNRYYYYARGVDIFGRTSNWSPRQQILTRTQPEYDAPVNVHGIFSKFEGRVNEVNADSTGNIILTTDLELGDDLLPALSGWDLKLTRWIMIQEPPYDQPAVRRPVNQLFEINSAYREGDAILFNIKTPPYAMFLPQARQRDFITIEYDFRFRVKFGWTGLQRLYNPSVDGFQVHLKNGSINVLQGRITTVRTIGEKQFQVVTDITSNVEVNELAESFCSINEHKFKIVAHTRGRNLRFDLEYLGYPLVEPLVGDRFVYTLKENHTVFIDYNDLRRWDHTYEKIPVAEPDWYESAARASANVDVIPEGYSSGAGSAERRLLLEQGIDWLPAGTFYKITVNRFPLPPALRNPQAQTYVPGVLTAYLAAEDQQKWADYYVFWHYWERNQLLVYALPREKGEAPPVFSINATTPCRFYPGQHYEMELELPAIPAFSAGDPTENYQLTFTASDVTGNRSEISPIVRMVAVNRQRPPRPLAPRIRSVSKMDYYHESRVELEWDRLDSPGITYQLYRATDVAIFNYDLNQRRTRQGVYRGLRPADVFRDDPDFNEWIRTRDTRVADLFVNPDHSNYASITSIWRAWSERFYGALNNSQLENIANAPGNEKAFTVLHSEPLKSLTYTDKLNGRIQNRYFYRLRSQNEAILQSTEWGPVSMPLETPAINPPNPPVFTRIEPGDKSVRLSWSLNRDLQLQEYVVYRGDRAEQVEDLRWWRLDPDPRVIGRVTDPRIKTSGRSVLLPGNLPVSSSRDIFGVFRADAFNFSATDPRHQPQALNYWITRPAYVHGLSLFIPAAVPEASHQLANLRPVADHLSMVVVYRDTTDRQFKVLQQYHLPEILDENLLGLTDYFYRMVAVDNNGNRSAGSEIKKARTMEIAPPEPPEATVVRRRGTGGNDRVRIDFISPHPAYQVLIQRRLDGSMTWVNIMEWQVPAGTYFEDTVEAGQSYLYRVWCKTPANLTCLTPPQILCLPLS